MQYFRTILPPLSGFPIIQPNDHLLSLGSCFAQHIGDRFQKGRWSVQLNPFGILYHPIPIAQGLLRLIEGTSFAEEDLFFHQEQWHSFTHHGHFSGPDKLETLSAMNMALKIGGEQLKKTNLLLLTLGTANGFVFNETGQVVGNCHKLPGKNFTKRLDKPEIIFEKLAIVFEKLKIQFPNLKIMLTVSPVRHLRDGLITNQRSKASLLLAAAELEKAFDSVCYFPAYEIMMDDLRDYRFYNNDLMHPTEMAIDYIWEYFRKNCFSESSQTYYEEISEINKGLNHRPLRPNSTAHQLFTEQLKAKMDILEKKYPWLNFGDKK